MIVSEILKEYLKTNGYDGLLCPDVPCGCALDDLAPCNNGNIMDCKPAYKIVCLGEKCKEHCEGYDGTILDGCYTTEKPKPKIIENIVAVMEAIISKKKGMFCKDCIYWKNEKCVSNKWGESVGTPDKLVDEVRYSYFEDGCFETGPLFGCVHFKNVVI